MKINNYCKCLCLLLLLCVVGCDEATLPPTTSHYTNILAVYFHEGNSYSVSYQDNNRIVIEPLSCMIGSSSAPWACAVELAPDVPTNSNMYAESSIRVMGRFHVAYYIIHIHSVDDINTAAWNHGKFGRGTTTRID